MSKYGPSSAFLLVGGKDISGDSTTLTDAVEGAADASHGLGDSWEESLPVGVAKAVLEAGGGLYDDRTAGIVEALVGMGSMQQAVAYGFAGHAIGADVTIVDGAFAGKFRRIIDRNALTRAEGTYSVTGANRRAQVLHGLTAETTASGNTTPSSVDRNSAPRLPSVAITNASVANPTVVTSIAHGLISGDVVMIAGSTTTPTIDGQRTVTALTADTFTVPVNVTVGGAQAAATFKKLTSSAAWAHLHVPALVLGGYTSVTVKVRHSVDNTTFTDLVTFANVAAAGRAEAVAVVAVVNRYVAMSWAFNGSGSGMSITPFVAIAR